MISRKATIRISKRSKKWSKLFSWKINNCFIKICFYLMCLEMTIMMSSNIPIKTGTVSTIWCRSPKYKIKKRIMEMMLISGNSKNAGLIVDLNSLKIVFKLVSLIFFTKRCIGSSNIWL